MEGELRARVYAHYNTKHTFCPCDFLLPRTLDPRRNLQLSSVQLHNSGLLCTCRLHQQFDTLMQLMHANLCAAGEDAVNLVFE